MRDTEQIWINRTVKRRLTAAAMRERIRTGKWVTVGQLATRACEQFLEKHNKNYKL